MVRMRIPRERDAAYDDAGFLLIEVVVAMIVFGLLAASVALVLSKAANTDRTNKLRVAATGLAAKGLAITRGTALDAKNAVDITQLVDGTTTSTVTQDSTTYTITQTIETTTSSVPGATCLTSTGTDLPSFKLIGEEVTWDRADGVAPVRDESLIALPPGAINSTLGAVSVAVSDSNGAPISGATVLLTGPSSSTSMSTDANGCAIFVNVAPGSGFSASVTKPGWVSALDASSVSTSSLVVKAATTLKVPLNPFEQGATVIADSATGGLPVDEPYTIKRTAKTTYVTGGAFPKPSGLVYASGGTYTAWMGSCADAQPASPVSFTATPGGTSNITLPSRALAILPVNGASVAVSGSPIYAVHLADAGSCTAGESHFLGTSTGAPMSVALPLGTWYIKTTATILPMPTYPSAQITITATSPSTTVKTQVAP